MYMSREYESVGDETVVPHLLQFSRRMVEYRYLAMRGFADTPVGLAFHEDIFDRLIKFIRLLAIFQTGYSNFD